MSYMGGTYDVIVVGAGHAAARLHLHLHEWVLKR